MGRSRGYILVLLVAIWATLPALARMCPQQIPPCCRGMRAMCCMNRNSPMANLCCPMQMQDTVASPAAIANSTDHVEDAALTGMVAPGPVQSVPSVVSAPVEIATSPPRPESRSFSILRI